MSNSVLTFMCWFTVGAAVIAILSLNIEHRGSMFRSEALAIKQLETKYKVYITPGEMHGYYKWNPKTQTSEVLNKKPSDLLESLNAVENK